jgi:hypothetical protein
LLARFFEVLTEELNIPILGLSRHWAFLKSGASTELA